VPDELIQQKDCEGRTSWIRRTTGEVVPQQKRTVQSLARAHLAELEPLLYEKLTRGSPLSWYELARVIDVLTKAASADAALGMLDARSLKDIQRCLEIMGKARSLCSAFSLETGDPGARRGDAQRTAAAFLTLPR